MPRLGDLPVKAIAAYAGIILVVALASRRPSSFVLFRPDAVAAALFLYVPLFRYARGPAPSWIAVHDFRRSAAVLLGLLVVAAAVYVGYSRRPLPASATPPPASAMPPAGEFLLRQAVFAAIPEEIFFRGYLFDAFDDKGWEPIVLTSALFAGGHLAIQASPYRAMTFFPGLLLGWSRRKTGNVYVPALLHLAFNAFPYLSGV